MFERSPDPMNDELQEQMTGIGDEITGLLREEIAGKGAVRAVLKKYLFLIADIC